MSQIIKTYPDPILRQRARDVEEIDKDLRKLAEQMLETMYASHGVGLAAPQVGVNLRVVVLNPTGEKEDERILINPQVVESRGAMEGEEGCLSFPGVSGLVRRSAHIVVVSYDLAGNEMRITADDFIARVLQHEIDHVEGTLFVDRMTPESRIAIRDALKSLEQSFGKDEKGGGRGDRGDRGNGGEGGDRGEGGL